MLYRNIMPLLQRYTLKGGVTCNVTDYVSTCNSRKDVKRQNISPSILSDTNKTLALSMWGVLPRPSSEYEIKGWFGTERSPMDDELTRWFWKASHEELIRCFWDGAVWIGIRLRSVWNVVKCPFSTNDTERKLLSLLTAWGGAGWAGVQKSSEKPIFDNEAEAMYGQ